TREEYPVHTSAGLWKLRGPVRGRVRGRSCLLAAASTPAERARCGPGDKSRTEGTQPGVRSSTRRRGGGYIRFLRLRCAIFAKLAVPPSCASKCDKHHDGLSMVRSGRFSRSNPHAFGLERVVCGYSRRS